MKQVYATGPLLAGTTNLNLDNTPAPGRRLSLPAIRGTSAGLQPHDLQSILPSALYGPPPAQAADQPLPIRLALLHTPNGRVLTHVTPNGGTFFSHTLLNVPETADAQLAIQTWGSPLWQRHDPNATSELPELPYLPVADVLDDVSLQDWLGFEVHREQLEFALTAFLGSSNDTRIFLGAQSHDVAKVVYALTRALPAGLLEGFTFSTFEADPLSCTARLIGHESGSAEQDLPAACYKGSGLALNSATGKRSDLAASVPFAQFAVESLASGKFGLLDDIKATWQRLGLKDARQLDLVYRLSRGTGSLTKDEASDALHHPPLAAWVSANETARGQFLEWALDDRAFANASFSRAVQSLRQSTDVMGKFAHSVREHGLQALTRGDKNRTANAFEVILPMVAPTKANAVWGELLAQVSDPNELTWEMRGYLLPRFVRFKLQQNPNAAVEPVFARWLDVAADRLGELLALDLPRNYQLAACRATLKRDGEPSATLARTLAQHAPLTLTLLQTGDTPANQAAALFETLLAEAPGQPWFEDVVAQAADYTPEALNRYFEATLAAGKVDADRLVRTQGARVLELFAGRSGLDTLGKQFLAQLPADLLHNQTVLGFLSQLREQANLSEELRTRLAAVQTLRDYLDRPTFDVERMQAVTAALALTPAAVPAATKSEVFSAVAGELKKRAESKEFQADLETVLIHFGTTLATDSTDLYENLLRDLRTRTELARHPKLVEGFLALALGAIQSPELAGKLDGLDGHAFAVASDAAKRGGNRLLNLLDGRAKEWSKEPRTKWGFLLTAVRPQGFKRTVRDFGFLLAGAAAASLAWWIASLVG